MFIILLPILLWIIYKYFTRNFDYWEKRNVSYEKPIPLFGNIIRPFLMKETIGDCFRKIYDKTKEPYLGVFVLNRPALLVNDIDMIKAILIKDFNYFYDRITVSDESVDPVGGNILFNAKSPHWNALRKTVNPIFSSGKIKQMHVLMQECVKEMTVYLKKIETKNIEIVEVLAKYTTNVITSTCFGINANCFEDENAKFRQVSKRMFDWNLLEVSVPMMCYFFAPKIVKLFKMTFISRFCIKFLKEAFSFALSERKRTGTNRNDLLDIILQIQASKKYGDLVLDDQKSFAQAVQFFFAGFETTSSMLSFCLFELVKNPEAMEKLLAEIKETKEKHGEFNYNVLQEMKYADMCIIETLRKYPSLPFLDRCCMEDYKLPGTDLVIEKGTPVFIPLIGLHYDSKYFYNADKFIPERTDAKVFPYMPFGEGPRNCMGIRFGILVIKTGLVELLSNFQLNVCDKTQEKIVFQPKGLLLAAQGGITLEVTPRCL